LRVTRFNYLPTSDECICRKGALGGEVETELRPSIDWVGSWEEVVVVARKLLPQEGHQVTKLGCVSVQVSCGTLQKIKLMYSLFEKEIFSSMIP
jgi:hypothetical protein